MKAKTKVRNAVIAMRRARADWEVERSMLTAQPMLTASVSFPQVDYLPGTGFMIDGVQWNGTAETIIADHERRTRDYIDETRRLRAERGVMEEVNDPEDIPF